MNVQNKTLIADFIQDIWNLQQFDKCDQYLHADFLDHSLPSALPSNQEGLKLWITNTGKSFDHKTFIEEMVCENDKLILKIKMQLKHIGSWRDIEPTYKEVEVIGYRYFKIVGSKIIEHWGLIDGNTLENQLRDASHSCKIQQ